jgi:N utilization substance protein B
VKRREAREQALRALYGAEQRGEVPETAGLSERARALIEGVWDERAGLDSAIGGASRRWRVERMPAVDRAVLRIAVYELRHRPNTPVAVVISEAVRLAAEYSTERSGRFVNGVLGALAESERGG